jgi:hypothetical protein
MLPILFNVGQVIDDIDCAGDHAEEDKGKGGPEQQGPDSQLLVKDEGQEHKAILDPLPGPQRPEESVDVGIQRLHHG